MSDIMRAIDFKKLINRIITEYKELGTIYNVKNIYRHKKNEHLTLFGNKLENPVGVAAGPHTQLAQNIVACYAGGSRYIELKTVQYLFGEDLGIPRPCIRAEDEAYNVEWSSEFSADKARDEYVKAYMACKFVAKEFGLGDPDGFIFNMSCGYNTEGIKHPLVNEFIDTLKDASNTEIFKYCKEVLLNMVDEFENVDDEFINSISPAVCNSLTLSTMHGCPPQEIEEISTYLIKEKKLNLYVKCNPTLLGYDYVRNTLDSMGYDYITFGKEQFDKDLNIEDAIPMIHRLQELADNTGVAFGVKLTNTFQSKIKYDELPGTDMYMSGKALYPLSIAVARLLSEKLDGKINISYCGGADKNNIEAIFNCGIWPITVCTVLLKPQGLENNLKLAEILENADYSKANALDVKEIAKLSESAITDKNYIKAEKAREKFDLHNSYVWTKDDDFECRILCKSCIKVCPNRANETVLLKDQEVILHIDENCNECGTCQFSCVEPCRPYRDRLTVFANKEDFINSENKGIFIEDNLISYRFTEVKENVSYEELPEDMENLYDGIKNKKFI